jgi:hypothetical protein
MAGWHESASLFFFQVAPGKPVFAMRFESLPRDALLFRDSFFFFRQFNSRYT